MAGAAHLVRCFSKVMPLYQSRLWIWVWFHPGTFGLVVSGLRTVFHPPPFLTQTVQFRQFYTFLKLIPTGIYLSDSVLRCYPNFLSFVLRVYGIINFFSVYVLCNVSGARTVSLIFLNIFKG